MDINGVRRKLVLHLKHGTNLKTLKQENVSVMDVLKQQLRKNIPIKRCIDSSVPYVEMTAGSFEHVNDITKTSWEVID